MELIGLFIGFEPDEILGRLVSVDFAELVLVFGTLFVSMTVLVIFGNWWSR